MGNFDPEKHYKRLDDETDSFLDRLKASEWTPVIIIAFILILALLAVALD